MAFYHQAHPWNPNYAIPDYVLAEPPGRGTFTDWLPRRTISAITPDYLAKPEEKDLYGKRSYGPSASAAMSGLGEERYILTPTGDDLSAPASSLPTAAIATPPASTGSKVPSWLIPVAAIAGVMFIFRKK